MPWLDRMLFTLSHACAVFGQPKHLTIYIHFSRFCIFCNVVQLRLYIHMILSCKMDSFATLWGIVCSSWVAINQYTSKRSKLYPEGNLERDYVVNANCMVSRFLALRRVYLHHRSYHIFISNLQHQFNQLSLTIYIYIGFDICIDLMILVLIHVYPIISRHYSYAPIYNGSISHFSIQCIYTHALVYI